MEVLWLLLLGVVVVCTEISDYQTLHHILQERAYNKRELPPTRGPDELTCVGVGFYMETLASISELDMDFVISIYLRQQWVDARLVHNSSGNIVVDIDSMADIWQPSLFFVNGKDERSHNVPVPNRFMMISPDGTVYFSQKLSVHLYCGMKLTKFPFDDQECPVRMMSYAYNTNMVELHWLNGNKSVMIRPDVELPEFVIDSTTLEDCTEAFISGVFSCLEVRVLLSRRSMHYVIQIYIPSTLIVILSWANFWIDHRSTPARVSLALLCILTITTQSAGVGSNLPRVAYLKAIDVWMSVCLVFVFSAFIEFTIVNIMARRLETKHTPSPVQALQEGAQRVSTVASNAVGICDPTDRPPTHGSAFHFFPSSFLLRRQTDPIETIIPPLTLDKYSRLVFPFLFVVFNLIYWLTYMTV